MVTVSARGYIKRQPLATYRRQARGGKGIIGARTVEEDAVAHLLVASTHDWALFFTNRGRVFSSKVHADPGRQPRRPRASRSSTSRASRSSRGERVLAVITSQLREGRQPGHGHPARASSRRRRSSSSSACARPASGPSRSPKTTSWRGSASRPATTTSSWRRRGPDRALPRERGPAHGPRRRRRHRHPAGQGRATRSSAWASSSPTRTSWC